MSLFSGIILKSDFQSSIQKTISVTMTGISIILAMIGISVMKENIISNVVTGISIIDYFCVILLLILCIILMKNLAFIKIECILEKIGICIFKNYILSFKYFNIKYVTCLICIFILSAIWLNTNNIFNWAYEDIYKLNAIVLKKNQFD